jgi:hypothetical protein
MATRFHTDNGVCSAGFMTIVHPAAIAGPSFHACISAGKFPAIPLAVIN